MRLTEARATWRRWQAAAGPWQGWMICPTLQSPEISDITPRPTPSAVRPRAHEIAAELERSFDERVVKKPEERTLLLLDLEPVLGIHVAARLNRAGVANVVLAMMRWPYVDAVLPVDTLLYALRSHSHGLVDRPLRHVAFVLDADRSRPLPDRPRFDRRADNRYRLSPFELPDLTTLEAQGVTSILKLAHR
jgi:hypothetical protein